ncbi:MAG: Polyferredoxin protein MvhB [Candidatus Bathyarchaeota archaeon BA1]|nr:MAG: Polyferredoxin protein MvhB [Candidatus Bathyarchaeota archaeon BA1]
MPMKLLKTENEKELIIERVHHAKRYSLILDKNVCVGCEICKIVCPKEAVEIKSFPKVTGGKAQRPDIDINEQRCHYCGICNVICPYGAIMVRTSGEPMIPVIKTESFPQLIREIEVDTKKCDVGCVECEKACPLNLIKVMVRTPEGEEVKDIESITNKESLTVTVDIKGDQCPCCRLCEMKCPEDAIHVRKIFHGTIKINPEKCPEGCQDCLDVCPIIGALYLSEEDKKVYENELYCVYCGVCRLVCSVEGALELQRTTIRHTPVHSGAWNKALEKLTSTKEMTKELRAKGLAKAQESVEKRLAWRAF